MKTIKSLFSALAMVALLATGAMAQGQASISASATVITDVELSGVQNLNFGSMTDGEAETGVTVEHNANNDDIASLGKFEMADLGSGQDIILSISAPDSLTSTTTFANATVNNLELTVEATYTETDNDVTAGTEFASLEQAITTGATTAYVYVGGTVGGTAGVYQGAYSGDITLSVYYD